MSGRRIVCTGDRRHPGWAYISDTLDNEGLHPNDYLAVGDADGADSHVRRYARERKINITVYPANWSLYGRAAGPIRNKLMLGEQQPNFVIAFPLKTSNGTWQCVNAAREMGIDVRIYQMKETT